MNARDRMEAAPKSSRGQNWLRGIYRLRQSRLSIVGAVVVFILMAVAVFGPFVVPYPDHVAGAIVSNQRFLQPSLTHPFGTNELGQDLFTLVIAGAQVSLLAGMAVVLMGAIVGTAVGAVAGYFGGWTDEILMRITDLKLSVPSLILAMAVAAALGAGLFNMIFAIALSWWPGYARLVRGEVIAKKEELFVQAAIALGAHPARVVWRHVLPNVLSPVIVKMSLDMGFAILAVASLGFIGIGVKPPMPEWGLMLSVSRGYLPDFWWTAIFPGLAIFLAVFGFNLLGDGLRDVFDPRARR